MSIEILIVKRKYDQAKKDLADLKWKRATVDHDEEVDEILGHQERYLDWYATQLLREASHMAALAEAENEPESITVPFSGPDEAIGSLYEGFEEAVKNSLGFAAFMNEVSRTIKQGDNDGQEA
jgi:hypothetical protein